MGGDFFGLIFYYLQIKWITIKFTRLIEHIYLGCHRFVSFRFFFLFFFTFYSSIRISVPGLMWEIRLKVNKQTFSWIETWSIVYSACVLVGWLVLLLLTKRTHTHTVIGLSFKHHFSFWRDPVYKFAFDVYAMLNFCLFLFLFFSSLLLLINDHSNVLNVKRNCVNHICLWRFLHVVWAVCRRCAMFIVMLSQNSWINMCVSACASAYVTALLSKAAQFNFQRFNTEVTCKERFAFRTINTSIILLHSENRLGSESSNYVVYWK